MKEDVREIEHHVITDEWTTKEINPQKIAEALGGVLQENPATSSGWTINLHYGEPNPLLTLRGTLDSRDMFLMVNSQQEGIENAHRCTVSLKNIEYLHFVEYRSTVSGIKKTSMAINTSDSGNGENAASIGISSHAHGSVI